MCKTDYWGRALSKMARGQRFVRIRKFACCLYLIFSIFSCAKQSSFQTIKKGSLEITGFHFTEIENNPLFKNAVESSIVLKNDQPIYFLDLGMNGNFSVGTSQQDMVTVSNNDRFSYVMSYKDAYYKFVKQTKGIMLYKSSNLYEWQVINNGNPVLTELGESNWLAIWNVGVTVDDQDVWHLLAESNSSADNSTAGLSYSYATMINDEISFDLNRSQNFVIEKAGNPWIGYVKDKGLIAVYGKQNNFYWNIKTAVLNGNTWIENQNLKIGKENIHVCDPHLLETENGLIMTVSFNQNSIYKLESGQTMDQFFNQVSGK